VTRVPDEVRKGMRERLWAMADDLAWECMSGADKSTKYENWTRDPDIGGTLGHYMDQRKNPRMASQAAAHYLRDLYLRFADHSQALRIRGLWDDDPGMVLKQYERPHGRLLVKNRMIAWGQARDWKAILMALHERTFDEPGSQPFAAILNSSTGKFQDDSVRAMVQDAADKLGIQRVVWL